VFARPTIIGVIRLDDPSAVAVAARGLAASSIDAIEVTLTSPGALEVLEQLSAQTDKQLLAGTIRTKSEIDACVEIGVAGVVSPHLDRELVSHALDRGIPMIPGALTPSEVAAAAKLGAAAVKVFPVDAVGGPAYIRALAPALGDVTFVVSGGIKPALADEFFAAGCAAICIGAAVLDKDAISERDEQAIARFADDQLSLVDIRSAR
jgi:2-dehydro-3-deoxyphosphogluconate aldolase/(4S)-4-hydroxy-2-oxoglutarate aldolase